MGRPYKCRYCSCTQTIRKGYRKIAQGKVQLRRCTKCRRKFTIPKLIPAVGEGAR